MSKIRVPHSGGTSVTPGETTPKVIEKQVRDLLRLALLLCTHKMHPSVGLTKLARKPKITPIMLSQDSAANGKLQKPLKGLMKFRSHSQLDHATDLLKILPRLLE